MVSAGSRPAVPIIRLYLSVENCISMRGLGMADVVNLLRMAPYVAVEGDAMLLSCCV